MVAGRLSAKLRTTPSVRDRDFGAVSHSLMFRPPGLLAIQVVPTAASLIGMAAMTFTSEHRMGHYFPTRRIQLK